MMAVPVKECMMMMLAIVVVVIVVTRKYQGLFRFISRMIIPKQKLILLSAFTSLSYCMTEVSK
jgi:hypothetical protein